MSFRIASALCALLAVACAAGVWRAGATPDRAGVAYELPPTAVLSPRRVPGVLLAASRDPVLRTSLQAVVDDGPENTCLTVEIDGRDVYEHNPNLAVVPASNLKLVTAQLALDLLGASHHYTTQVIAPAPDDGTVVGDLVLVGGGDPVLGTEAWGAHFADQPAVVTSLESLADRVADAGITHVTGSVVGDESRYDSLRSVPSWPDRYVEQRQLGPLSALTVNGGLTAFPERLTEHNRTEVTLADDPPAHAAGVFTELLRERGVQVDGEPRAAAGSVVDGEPIAKVVSPPLTDIVRHMLSESDNQVAELLVKEIGVVEGEGGTTEAGVAAMTAGLDDLGIPTRGVVIRDGSGLDEGDRLTCTVIADLLERAGESSPTGQGLAVAGETGTLRDRFPEDLAGAIRAKTGTLNEVTALSGFAASTGGPVLTFAYVANGELVGPELLGLQDRLGEALVDYAGSTSIDAIGPR